MSYKKLLSKIKYKIRILFVNHTWDSYKGKPILTIKEICKLIGIEMPKLYTGIKDLPIYQIDHFIKLQNKEEIEKNIMRNRKFTETQCIELRKYLRKFKRKYNNQDCIREKSNEQLINMLIEWYYCFDNYGFDYDDYFDYEVFNKSIQDLENFLNKGYKKTIFRVCNDKKYTHYCKNKGDFNKKFNKFVYRDWLVASECNYEEFFLFVKHHPRFFAKPVEGTGGASAQIINVENEKNIKKLYIKCKKNKYICEEIVKQHKEMSKFNESTLNTLRLYTLVTKNGIPIITLGNARFGRAGNDVDNFHSGGVSAVIDLETGTLISDAINRAHIKVSHHPDSNIKFKGFQIPNFEECKKVVCEAALMVKGLRHIGWDVAITDDGHIELIEGNAFPNFDITQAADQIGKKGRYKKYIDELRCLKNDK